MNLGTEQSAEVAQHRPPAGWDDYVGRHPLASAYHRSRWSMSASQSLGLSAYYVTCRGPDGALSGVMPLIRQKNLLFGDRLTSLPFFNYGGPLADDPAIARLLLYRSVVLAESLGSSQVEIRSEGAPAVDWPARQDKATLLLDLPPTVDGLSKQLGSKLRSQVKRAQREAATASFGQAELLPSFYQVFSEVMRDLGTPVYPRRFFERLLQDCSQDSTLVVLSLDERPVSAAYLVAHGDRLEIPWAATISAVRNRSINMALYWEVLRYAVEHGHACFDFGRSTIDSGPYRFKLQWGARPVPLQWPTWRPGATDSVTPEASTGEGRAHEWATRLWRRLPVTVANRLGPIISPTLPW